VVVWGGGCGGLGGGGGGGGSRGKVLARVGYTYSRAIVCCIDCFGHCSFYDRVLTAMQYFFVMYHVTSHWSLVFSWNSLTHLKALTYTKKIQLTCGTFHGIPFESVAKVVF